MNLEMVTRHLAVFTAIGQAIETLNNKGKAARYDGMVTEYKNSGKAAKQILEFYAAEIQKMGHWPKDEKGDFVGWNKAAETDTTAKGFMAFRTYLNNWYEPETLKKREVSISAGKDKEKKDKRKEEQEKAEKELLKAKEAAIPLTVKTALEFLKSRKAGTAKIQNQIDRAIATLEKNMTE